MSEVIWSRSLTGQLVVNYATGGVFVLGRPVDDGLIEGFEDGDSVTFTCELVREGDLLVKREFVRKA